MNVSNFVFHGKSVVLMKAQFFWRVRKVNNVMDVIKPVARKSNEKKAMVRFWVLNIYLILISIYNIS